MMYFALAGYALFLLGLLALSVVAFLRVPRAWRIVLGIIWALLVGAHLLIVFGGAVITAIAGLSLISLTPVMLVFPVRVARPVPWAEILPRILGPLAFVYAASIMAYLTFGENVPGLSNFALGLVSLALIGAGLTWLKNKAGVMILGLFFLVVSGVGFMSIGVLTLPIALLFLMAALVQVGEGPAPNLKAGA